MNSQIREVQRGLDGREKANCILEWVLTEATIKKYSLNNLHQKQLLFTMLNPF